MPPASSSRDRTIRVYLTGFGSFSRIQDNPSGAISTLLSPHTTLELPSRRLKIIIQPHPHPLKVCYTTIDTIIPSIWESGGWDYILHLGCGLAGGYELETIAHEKGYDKPDVNGEVGDGGESGRVKEFKGVQGREVEGRKGFGRMFKTGVDVEWCVEAVRRKVAVVDTGESVKIAKSVNAGMYLCEYIFRASLMEAAKRGLEASKRVLFMHVPPAGEPYSVETGCEVAKALVEAMVLHGEGFREETDTPSSHL